MTIKSKDYRINPKPCLFIENKPKDMNEIDNAVIAGYNKEEC